jgi:glucokinase
MKTNPVILVLDAGGTNLVFNAVQNGRVTGKPVVLPAASANLNEFLQKLIAGFKTVNQQSGNNAAAISFAFPGPADYENGIIGDLENLPFFRGGVPLKKMLENHFKIPVFINNDGDLFTLGEALGGILPEINALSEKQYRNLLGITLGTGFGGGVVIDNRLLKGDNSAAGEINRISNFLNRKQSAESVLSKRGVKRLFSENAGIDFSSSPEPFDIYRIATGDMSGNKQAALKAWDTFAEVLADAIANAVTLTDSNVVIGGGLSGAWPLFLQKTVNLLNGKFVTAQGDPIQRLEVFAYNWHDPHCRKDFLKSDYSEIKVPFYDETIRWDKEKKITVAISNLGTSEAVALGACHFATEKL